MSFKRQKENARGKKNMIKEILCRVMSQFDPDIFLISAANCFHSLNEP